MATKKPATLHEAVNQYLDEQQNDGYTRETALLELCEHGAASGIIWTLISYKQCADFFIEHKEEILKMVTMFLTFNGLNVSLVIPKWDDADPFALNVYNQTMLVYWCIDRVANVIARTNPAKHDPPELSLEDFIEEA